MFARTIVLSALLAAPLLSGCGMKQATKQLGTAGFLSFEGARAGLMAQIDDGPPVELTSPRDDTQYTVNKGSHRVRVLDGDVVILDQMVFVSSGQVTVLAVPE